MDYQELIQTREAKRKAEAARTTDQGLRITRLAERIARNGHERNRLLQTLAYYEWLGARGIAYNDIRGARYELQPVPAWKARRSYNLLMVDGSQVIIHDPPFEDAVIFNRSYLLPEDLATDLQEVADDDQAEAAGQASRAEDAGGLPAEPGVEDAEAADLRGD